MGDSASSDIMSSTIHWTDKLEEYFVTTGEKAHCLSWIHKRSEELFSVRRTFIDLPVIVGSGVIAFLNAGSQSMFDDPRISSIALGVGSLVVGILNTMGTYFGWAKRAEGHRISSIDYAKLYRFISVEMSLPREERMGPKDLLKKVKDDYDRLAEISPLVPSSVIRKFKTQFKKETSISKPEEANGLHKIEIYRPSKTDIENGIGLSSTPRAVSDSVPITINPLFKPKSKAKNEDTYTPTIKEIEQVEQSIQIPTIPKEIEPKTETSS